MASLAVAEDCWIGLSSADVSSKKTAHTNKSLWLLKNCRDITRRMTVGQYFEVVICNPVTLKIIIAVRSYLYAATCKYVAVLI